MDDLDLYEDLDEFQEQQERKSKELQDAEEKYQLSLKTIQSLEEENKALTKKIKRIELSFQSLLDTARTEIRRKDKEIERLRKEKDDVCFRRKFPNRSKETDSSLQQVVSNPFAQGAATERNFSDEKKSAETENDAVIERELNEEYKESQKRHRPRDSNIPDNHKRQRCEEDNGHGVQKSTETYREQRRERLKDEKEQRNYKSDHREKTDDRNECRNRDRYNDHKYSGDRKTIKSAESSERCDYRRHRDRYDGEHRKNQRTRDDKTNHNSSSKSPERKERNRSSERKERSKKSSQNFERRERHDRDRTSHQQPKLGIEDASEKGKSVGKHQQRSNVLTDAESKSAPSSETQSTSDKNKSPVVTNEKPLTQEDVQINTPSADNSNLQTNICNKKIGGEKCDIKNAKATATKGSSNSHENIEITSREMEELLYEDLDYVENTNSNVNKPQEESNHGAIETGRSHLDIREVLYENIEANLDKPEPETNENNRLQAIKENGNQQTTISTSHIINNLNNDDLVEEPTKENTANNQPQEPAINQKPSQKTPNPLGSTPNKVALFDALFGPSPSSSSGSNISKKLLSNIMGILSTSKTDGGSTATTPGEYSDCMVVTTPLKKSNVEVYDKDEFDKCFAKIADKHRKEATLELVEDLFAKEVECLTQDHEMNIKVKEHTSNGETLKVNEKNTKKISNPIDNCGETQINTDFEKTPERPSTKYRSHVHIPGLDLITNDVEEILSGDVSKVFATEESLLTPELALSLIHGKSQHLSPVLSSNSLVKRQENQVRFEFALENTPYEKHQDALTTEPHTNYSQNIEDSLYGIDFGNSETNMPELNLTSSRQTKLSVPVISNRSEDSTSSKDSLLSEKLLDCGPTVIIPGLDLTSKDDQENPDESPTVGLSIAKKTVEECTSNDNLLSADLISGQDLTSPKNFSFLQKSSESINLTDLNHIHSEDLCFRPAGNLTPVKNSISKISTEECSSLKNHEKNVDTQENSSDIVPNVVVAEELRLELALELENSEMQNQEDRVSSGVGALESEKNPLNQDVPATTKTVLNCSTNSDDSLYEEASSDLNKLEQKSNESTVAIPGLDFTSSEGYKSLEKSPISDLTAELVSDTTEKGLSNLQIAENRVEHVLASPTSAVPIPCLDLTSPEASSSINNCIASPKSIGSKENPGDNQIGCVTAVLLPNLEIRNISAVVDELDSNNESHHSPSSTSGTITPVLDLITLEAQKSQNEIETDTKKSTHDAIHAKHVLHSPKITVSIPCLDLTSPETPSSLKKKDVPENSIESEEKLITSDHVSARIPITCLDMTIPEVETIDRTAAVAEDLNFNKIDKACDSPAISQVVDLTTAEDQECLRQIPASNLTTVAISTSNRSADANHSTSNSSPSAISGSHVLTSPKPNVPCLDLTTPEAFPSLKKQQFTPTTNESSALKECTVTSNVDEGDEEITIIFPLDMEEVQNASSTVQNVVEELNSNNSRVEKSCDSSSNNGIKSNEISQEQSLEQNVIEIEDDGIFDRHKTDKSHIFTCSSGVKKSDEYPPEAEEVYIEGDKETEDEIQDQNMFDDKTRNSEGIRSNEHDNFNSKSLDMETEKLTEETDTHKVHRDDVIIEESNKSTFELKDNIIKTKRFVQTSDQSEDLTAKNDCQQIVEDELPIKRKGIVEKSDQFLDLTEANDCQQILQDESDISPEELPCNEPAEKQSNNTKEITEIPAEAIEGNLAAVPSPNQEDKCATICSSENVDKNMNSQVGKPTSPRESIESCDPSEISAENSLENLAAVPSANQDKCATICLPENVDTNMNSQVWKPSSPRKSIKSCDPSEISAENCVSEKLNISESTQSRNSNEVIEKDNFVSSGECKECDEQKLSLNQNNNLDALEKGTNLADQINDEHSLLAEVIVTNKQTDTSEENKGTEGINKHSSHLQSALVGLTNPEENRQNETMISKITKDVAVVNPVKNVTSEVVEDSEKDSNSIAPTANETNNEELNTNSNRSTHLSEENNSSLVVNPDLTFQVGEKSEKDSNSIVSTANEINNEELNTNSNRSTHSSEENSSSLVVNPDLTFQVVEDSEKDSNSIVPTANETNNEELNTNSNRSTHSSEENSSSLVVNPDLTFQVVENSENDSNAIAPTANETDNKELYTSSNRNTHSSEENSSSLVVNLDLTSEVAENMEKDSNSIALTANEIVDKDLNTNSNRSTHSSEENSRSLVINPDLASEVVEDSKKDSDSIAPTANAIVDKDLNTSSNKCTHSSEENVDLSNGGGKEHLQKLQHDQELHTPEEGNPIKITELNLLNACEQSPSLSNENISQKYPPVDNCSGEVLNCEPNSPQTDRLSHNKDDRQFKVPDENATPVESNGPLQVLSKNSKVIEPMKHKSSENFPNAHQLDDNKTSNNSVNTTNDRQKEMETFKTSPNQNLLIENTPETAKRQATHFIHTKNKSTALRPSQDLQIIHHEVLKSPSDPKIQTPQQEKTLTTLTVTTKANVNQNLATNVAQHFPQNLNPEMKLSLLKAKESPQKINLNITNNSLKTITPAGNALGEMSQKRIIINTTADSSNTLKSSTLTDGFNAPIRLPSISTDCPTPSNFSGIFSKTSQDSTSEESIKNKKKSPKPNEYILPAASVLCNMDNLKNAANKKLHWELLEKDNEMDDADPKVSAEKESEKAASKQLSATTQYRSLTNNVSLTPTSNDLRCLETIKKNGSESEETKSLTLPSWNEGGKLKKSKLTRRNTIDTVPITQAVSYYKQLQELEHFKDLAITANKGQPKQSEEVLNITTSAIEPSAASPAKVIKHRPQKSRMSRKLRAKLMASSPIRVRSAQSLMDASLFKAAMIKKKKVCVCLASKVRGGRLLNLASSNCKKMKRLNDKVQQINSRDKKQLKCRKSKLQSLGNVVEKEHVEDILSSNMQEKLVLKNKDKETAVEGDTSAGLSNENNGEQQKVTKSIEQTIIKLGAGECSPKNSVEKCANLEYDDHQRVQDNITFKTPTKRGCCPKLTPTLTTPGEGEIVKNGNSESEESPAKEDDHLNTSIIYDKEHSSDGQSSLAENSEPECNKYLKDDELTPRTIAPSNTQKCVTVAEKPKDKVEIAQEPIVKSVTERTFIMNYKIPKLKKSTADSESSSCNKNKIISLEDIGIKMRPFKGHLSSFRIPKINKAAEVTKEKSWVLESYKSIPDLTVEADKGRAKTETLREIAKEEPPGGRQGKRDEKPRVRSQTKDEIRGKGQEGAYIDHNVSSIENKSQDSGKKEKLKARRKSINIPRANDGYNDLLSTASGKSLEINSGPSTNHSTSSTIKDRRKSLCLQQILRDFSSDGEGSSEDYNFQDKSRASLALNSNSASSGDLPQALGIKGRRKSLNIQKRIRDFSSDEEGSEGFNFEDKSIAELNKHKNNSLTVELKVSNSKADRKTLNITKRLKEEKGSELVKVSKSRLFSTTKERTPQVNSSVEKRQLQLTGGCRDSLYPHGKECSQLNDFDSEDESIMEYCKQNCNTTPNIRESIQSFQKMSKDCDKQMRTHEVSNKSKISNENSSKSSKIQSKSHHAREKQNGEDLSHEGIPVEIEKPTKMRRKSMYVERKMDSDSGDMNTRQQHDDNSTKSIGKRRKSMFVDEKTSNSPQEYSAVSSSQQGTSGNKATHHQTDPRKQPQHYADGQQNRNVCHAGMREENKCGNDQKRKESEKPIKSRRKSMYVEGKTDSSSCSLDVNQPQNIDANSGATKHDEAATKPDDSSTKSMGKRRKSMFVERTTLNSLEDNVAAIHHQTEPKKYSQLSVENQHSGNVSSQGMKEEYKSDKVSKEAARKAEKPIKTRRKSMCVEGKTDSSSCSLGIKQQDINENSQATKRDENSKKPMGKRRKSMFVERTTLYSSEECSGVSSSQQYTGDTKDNDAANHHQTEPMKKEEENKSDKVRNEEVKNVEKPIKTRRKSMYAEGTKEGNDSSSCSLDRRQENSGATEHDENATNHNETSAKYIGKRRKSMFVDRKTSNSSEECISQQCTSDNKDNVVASQQTESIKHSERSLENQYNANAISRGMKKEKRIDKVTNDQGNHQLGKAEKPIKSRRKSIYVEGKTDSSSRSLDINQKDFDENRGATKHDEISTKSIGKRRKSMVEERKTSNSSEECSGDIISQQCSSGNHQIEPVKHLIIRRKSVHVDREPKASENEMIAVDAATNQWTIGNDNKVNKEEIQDDTNKRNPTDSLNIRRKSMYVDNESRNSLQTTKKENKAKKDSTTESLQHRKDLDIRSAIQSSSSCDIQTFEAKPHHIKSIRMTKKSKKAERESLNHGEESKDLTTTDGSKDEKYLQYSQNGSSSTMLAEKNRETELNNAGRCSKSTKPLRLRSKSMYIENPNLNHNHNQNENEAEGQQIPHKETDHQSDSDTSTMMRNININKMRRKSLNIQRRILDSSSDEDDDIPLPLKPVIQHVVDIVPPPPARKKRRIVKVLSTSHEDPFAAVAVKKPKHIVEELQAAISQSPISPTLNHPIFHTQVRDEPQPDINNMTPLSHDDDRFKEIDSTMQDMFHSPQREPEDFKSQLTVQESTLSPLREPPLNESKQTNLTIDETVYSNRENEQSTATTASELQDSKSISNSAASHNNSDTTKHLSLGSSDYRFEKVSENVVNLFISRKRKRKRTN